jgi:hypothetical protein
MDNPIVAAMAPSATTQVTATGADGTTVNVPVSDGVYVYQGRTPFEIDVTTADGQTRNNRVEAIPSAALKAAP